MTIAVILSKLQTTSRHTFDLPTLFSQNGHVVGNTNRTTVSSTILQDSLTANGLSDPTPVTWINECDLYSPQNDPDPEMILTRKWSPLFFLSIPKCFGHDGVFSCQLSLCNSVHCCGGTVCRSFLINFCFSVWNIDWYVFSGMVAESLMYIQRLMMLIMASNWCFSVGRCTGIIRCL